MAASGNTETIEADNEDMTFIAEDVVGIDSHVRIDPPVLYFGTPIGILSSLNPDGSTNIAPNSSLWYLADRVVIGIGSSSKTLSNLRRHRELVVNLPSSDLRDAVEKLGRYTGSHPVPEEKREKYIYAPDKFSATCLTETPSEEVRPAGVGECPIRLEAVVQQINESGSGGFALVEARVLSSWARPELSTDGGKHVSIRQWNPLFYVFRHYFGLGEHLGADWKAN